MARGKSILPMIRRIIVEQHKAGVSQAQIARDFDLNRQTIHRVLQLEAAKIAGQNDAD